MAKKQDKRYLESIQRIKELTEQIETAKEMQQNYEAQTKALNKKVK